MSKLNDTIYGIAFRNHRYEKDEYNISLYFKLIDRDFALSCMDKKAEIVKFEFKPIDLIKKED